MITIGQMLDWVMEHRKGKVFKGYTRGEVAAALQEGVESNTLWYVSAPCGKIVGMILFTKLTKPKVLFVIENMAMSVKTLGVFAKRAKQEYPGWNIEGMRHDTHRKFNTSKLYRKLQA